MIFANIVYGLAKVFLNKKVVAFATWEMGI